MFTKLDLIINVVRNSTEDITFYIIVFFHHVSELTVCVHVCSCPQEMQLQGCKLLLNTHPHTLTDTHTHTHTHSHTQMHKYTYTVYADT